MKKITVLVVFVVFVACVLVGCGGYYTSSSDVETPETVAVATDDAIDEKLLRSEEYLDWSESDWSKATDEERENCVLFTVLYINKLNGVPFDPAGDYDLQIAQMKQVLPTLLYKHNYSRISSLTDELAERFKPKDSEGAPSPTETPTATPATLSTTNDVTMYYEGQYKIGNDMPKGEYVLVAGEYGGYFCVSSDANGDDIICNDNFDINSIVTVKEGEYLELSRCIAVPAEEFYTEHAIPKGKSGVMYKVGVDLEPGEYKVKAVTGDSGYYCIYNDSRHDDIVANDNFEGSSYVKVKKGQYLILSGCLISES